MRFVYRTPKSKMIRQEFQNCNYILSIHIIFCLLKGQNDNDATCLNACIWQNIFGCKFLEKWRKWIKNDKQAPKMSVCLLLPEILIRISKLSEIITQKYSCPVTHTIHCTVCILKTCRQQLNFKNIFLIFPRLLKT